MGDAKTFAYNAMINGIYYNLNHFVSYTAEVTYYSYDSSYNKTAYIGSVVIPESVTYDGCTYSVTSIGQYAFRGCTGLTSITIPNSVTSISDFAFSECSGLISITIPNSVTRIENYAFSGCTGLTSITIPNSVTSIGIKAFNETGWYYAQSDGILYLDNWLLGYKGSKPTGDITIKSETKALANGAFSNCKELTGINIPNSVTSISEYAFSTCKGLTSITIPNSVTSIGFHAFVVVYLKGYEQPGVSNTNYL